MKVMYATVVSLEHVTMGLALAKLLNSFNKKLSVFCIDKDAASILLENKFDNLEVFAPSDFEDESLKTVKHSRSKSEYCWTCKPYILNYLLKRFPELDWAVYLDSDMMIFNDPDLVLPKEEDVLLTPHNFSKEFKSFENDVGDFNAGYAAFKNNKNGLMAVSWWRNRCLEDCSAKPKNGFYGDQVYLDKLDKKFSFVKKNIHPGLNAAPWNILNKKISLEDGILSIGDAPMIIYHMQGLQFNNFGLINLYDGEIKIKKELKDLVYKPYLNNVMKVFNLVDSQTYKPIIKRLTFKRILREIKRMILYKNNMIYFGTRPYQ